MNFKKTKAMVMVGLFASGAVMAGGNGGGDEPPMKPVKTSLICDILPLYCMTETQGGNGGGDEPPDIRK
ncbi:hypothetical protein [Bowmanella dokdonensis]|uniref:Uncharacterized protein n=1 Tax=Bowmanella dokdonensis TaxID=751969 RepID=A0A939DRK3_9ALTE|nr:hypothetical protein [Bowmanella dokdonensis]MBN7826930.1 hypothetical protein [Bowmanella dokdonensis]